MADDAGTLRDQARADAYAMPLEDLHPGDPDLFLTDSFWPYFERLRRDRKSVV